MMIRVWEYDVQESAAADFERIYGADGAWAQLFSSSDGFEGTELFASVSNSGRYLTSIGSATRNRGGGSRPSTARPAWPSMPRARG